MKLNNIQFDLNSFASEMAKLKNDQHFDFLVTIVGEDFGAEGLGCLYILENTCFSSNLFIKTAFQIVVCFFVSLAIVIVIQRIKYLRLLLIGSR